MFEGISPAVEFCLTAVAVGLIGILFVVFVWAPISNIIDRRNVKALENILKLKYSVDVNDKEALKIALFNYYGPEKIQNRVSNFIGLFSYTILTVFGWALSLGFIIYCGYEIYTGAFTEPQLLWLFLAARILIFVVGLSVMFLSKLLTNRYPGEAKKVLKNAL